MKSVFLPLTCLLVFVSATAAAQPASGPVARLSVDLFELVDQLADEMNREFILDQRLAGNPGLTTAAADADYDTLLGILRTLGYVAVDNGEQIRIVPEAVARSLPSPVVQADDRDVSDHTIVTRILTVDGVEVAQMIPTLRPMLPQSAHIGSVPNSNRLIIVDHYDNVRRMTRVIEELTDSAAE